MSGGFNVLTTGFDIAAVVVVVVAADIVVTGAVVAVAIVAVYVVAGVVVAVVVVAGIAAVIVVVVISTCDSCMIVVAYHFLDCSMVANTVVVVGMEGIEVNGIAAVVGLVDCEVVPGRVKEAIFCVFVSDVAGDVDWTV